MADSANSSSTMSSTSLSIAGLRRSSVRIAAATVLLLTVVTAGVTSASAEGEVSLPGSLFEIDVDANTVVDVAGALDWDVVSAAVQPDLPSGSNDDAFGQGTKEDSSDPKVVSGSIPPNKSDLSAFGYFLEATDAGDDYFHVFWSRVQNPSGTTNMDFEFNQSGDVDDQGIPIRTPGDALVVYELSKGGTVPVLFIFRWLADASQGRV